jgi:4-amino-4-deoxy-L-arabinose transferase-like glycosyltransferase
MGSTRTVQVLAVAFAALGTALAWTASSRMSVTVDEFQALPAGLAVLETGDFRFPKGTPVLSEVLPALPLFLSGARVGAPARDPELSSWGLSHEVMNRQGTAFLGLFPAARFVSLLMLFLVFALTFGYSRRLYGERGALLSLGVACLCPNLLGHGALVTPDIYLAAATLAFLWALFELFERPSASIALSAGVALGAAAAMKFTGLVFFPLAILLAFHIRPNPSRHIFTHFLPLVFFAALFTIHAAYAFRGSFALLGNFSFASHLFQSLQARLPASLPVFLPFHYVRALDEQLAEPAYLAYFAGEFNKEGFFSYYLVAWLVKTPLATLLIALLAWSSRWRADPRERHYLVFAATMFLFFSIGRHKNIGLRYLLFLFPLLAVWCGRIAANAGTLAGRVTRAHASAALLACLFFGTIIAWPDYLAYFSPAIGGGAAGHRYLLDSNLDWGQGLIELRSFLERNHVDRISLAYAGRVRPDLYGLNYENLGDAPPKESVVAVSANLVWGRTYFVNGTNYWPKSPDVYAKWRDREPWAVLGNTIYVYRVGTR